MPPDERYIHILARNMVLDEEYGAILDAFAAADIPAISLKGIALIQRIYADPGERYVGDCDLLVKPEDVELARVVLNGLGYATPSAYVDPVKKGSDPFVCLRSFAFTKRSGVGFYVHLHWHLINSVLPLFMIMVGMDDVWRQSIVEEGSERSFRVLAPHHEVVFLSLHAFKHSYNKMSLFTDIAKTIEYYADRLDWERVLLCAHEWKVMTPLYYSLSLTSVVAKIRIPDEVLKESMPEKKTNLIDTVLRRVRDGHLRTENIVFWIWLDMVKGFVPKLRFIFFSLFRNK